MKKAEQREQYIIDDKREREKMREKGRSWETRRRERDSDQL